MRYLALLLLLIVPTLCAQDKTPTPGNKTAHPASASVSFKASVQQMADAWLAAFQAKDADKIAAMYSDDAVLINPEGTFHGSGEIKNELKKMLDRGDTVSAITTTNAMHSTDLGWAQGTFSSTMPNPKGGDPVPMNGSWATTLKKSGSGWLIATHTSIPSAPPKAMSKAAK